MSNPQPSLPVVGPRLVPEGASSEVARERQGKRRLLVVAGAFAATLALYVGVRALGAGSETTDDAMIDADVVPVAARVGGQVLAVHVVDNAKVKKGDVLVELDAAELAARVRQAEGELAAAQAQAAAADAQLQVTTASARGGLSTARAQVSTSRVQVSSAEAQIAAAKAQLVRAETDARKASTDLERAKQLHAANAIPQERLENAQAAFDTAQAGLAAAKAQLAAATEARAMAESRVSEANGLLDANAPMDAKIEAAKASAELAHARVKTAEAALELATLAHSYARVIAPVDGTVAKLTTRPGQLLGPGQMIASVVPDATYVVANFKETQIGRMQPGQKVEVEIDSHPGEKFDAVVESITPGTGSRFSLLAPDNASGNFVKVVQRVPVRIRWARPSDRVMRPGESAVVRVYVGS